MKDSFRQLFVAGALALYFLAIGMAGMRNAPTSFAEVSSLTAERSFVAAHGLQAIPIHFASAETGATESFIRLKNCSLGYRFPELLEKVEAQEILRTRISSEDRPIHFFVRQIIYPFHSFW